MGVSFIGTSGLWFAGANLCRDLASLYGMELLPWDYWGEVEAFMLEPDVFADHLDRLDDLANTMVAATAEPMMPARHELWPSWLSLAANTKQLRRR